MLDDANIILVCRRSMRGKEMETVTTCHDMEVGQVYRCKECGLEIQVVKTCTECKTESKDCGCDDSCTFECCGKSLKLKKAKAKKKAK
jgi:hypothetical protein